MGTPDAPAPETAVILPTSEARSSCDANVFTFMPGQNKKKELYKRDITMTTVKEQVQEKIDTSRQIIKTFYPELVKSLAKNDPRLLDLIYELSFSENMSDEISMNKVYIRTDGMNLTSFIRYIIYKMKVFDKPSHDVDYMIDLMTRAMSSIEGSQKCPKCDSTNTTFTVRQTRSSDEAPTALIFCGSCGYRTEV